MILVQARYCPQNHRCPTLRVCPTGALQQSGFSAPTIDPETCIECGSCVQSCRVFREVPVASGGGGDSLAPDGERADRPGTTDILDRL